MLFLQKVSNRIRGELQVCLLDIDSFPVCVYFSINILVASSGLKAQTCISEYPLPGEFSNLGGAPTSFLDFPIWNMGAKAPILYTTLVNLVSHFSFVYFELKNAQWKLCELFFFFLAFSLLHISMVDIYRYTDVFFFTLIIMRSLKEHTTQNVPRIKASDENVTKSFLQIVSLQDFVIRMI